jgi:sterol desaturase/sphingolipid hydroxylase (fatty acid hydroxylase superfamily)
VTCAPAANSALFDSWSGLEHHSVHHQLDLHSFNYGDITWWDRLFGTFRQTDTFAAHCGFPDNHERHLTRMLLFRDSY